MNFFTSSSDRPCHVLGAFLLTFLLSLALASGALKLYVAMTTGPEHFVQEIGSKAKHMRLSKPPGGYDAVFVGNSRTEYGIDRSVFAAYGFSTYNFGVAGAELVNYPSMVERAASQRPVYVFLGIRPEEFFKADLSINADLSWRDVTALWAAPFPLREKLRGFYGWLSGLNAVRQYADQIYTRLETAYRAFSPAGVADAPVPASAAAESDEDEFCRVVGRTVLAGGLVSYKCASGDFVMQGHIDPAPAVLPEFLPDEMKTLSTAKISYLTAVSHDIAERHGARLVIVLEPAPADDPLADAATDALKARGLRVIDMTRHETDPDHWGDGVHFNVKGRRHYSRQLAAAITPLLQDPSGFAAQPARDP